MHHLNLCRQMTKNMSSLVNMPSLSRELLPVLRHMMDLSAASEKFLLPVNGKLIDDPQYRGLDGDAPLRLPYDFVALEFELEEKDREETEIPGVLEKTNAMIVFARQVEGNIVFSSAHRFVSDGQWEPLPGGAISSVGSRQKAADGRMQVATEVMLDDVSTRNDNIRPVQTVLSFLNALSCSNVKPVKSPAQNSQKALRKKGALPFDDYHILTINVPGKVQSIGEGLGLSHRSPREHLRRGHIRRYESGLRIWVNAHVVNAGVGGKVTKDYRLAA